MNLRDRFIMFNVHSLGLPLVKKMVPAEEIPFTMEELHQLPEGTMGNELFHFLSKNHFGFLPHFETHDAKHVLLNYSATVKDEACMQFFYLGNRHYSLATITSVLSGFILLPEHVFAFRKAFLRGRKAKPIGKLPLQKMLCCNTTGLRKQFEIETNS